MYRIGFINCCAEDSPRQQITAQHCLTLWLTIQLRAIVDKPEELDCYSDIIV